MIHYTKDYIRSLLNKFMEGTSTLDEETVLSQYFTRQQVPAEWEEYRLLFAELEAMKPEEKPRRRWLLWSAAAAAAVVAGIVTLTMPSSEAEQEKHVLMAQADTTTTNHGDGSADTIVSDKKTDRTVPTIQKKKSLRKQEPTIHDYAKAYTLLAEVHQERQEVEEQMAQCHQELIEAQLAAYGYVPVIQEDGSILYMNEQTNYTAYEE